MITLKLKDPWLRALLLVFLLGLAVRLVALAEVRGSPWNRILMGDAAYFDAWGQRLADGQSDRGTVFFQAPLYPYLLGGVYRLFGHVPDLVRLLQCVGGALAAVLIAAGTRRLASTRAALVAGVFAALYAPAIWYDLQIEKTSPALLLTSLIFWLMAARPAAGRPRPFLAVALAAGVALGALALLRENAAVLALPLGFVLARAAGAGRRRVLAAFVAGAALCLLPVALHNLDAGGAPLPTTSNAGVNFWIGNGAGADGQYRELVPGRGHPDYEQQDAKRLAEQAESRTLSPAGVSRHWFGRALDEMAAAPGRAIGIAARKFRLLAVRDEIMDSVSLQVFQDTSVTLRVLGIISYGLLLPLALAGAVLVASRPGVRPVLASIALLALSIALFFVMGRFRLGLVPLLIPLAGVAVDQWRRLPRLPLALAALVLGAAASWWPVTGLGDARAASAANLANEYLRRADFPEAERWAADAWRRASGSAEAAYNLGLALRWQGKYAEAREPLRAAMRLQPAYSANCLAELGAITAALGDPAAARPLLEQSLRLQPGHEGALRYLELVNRSAPAPPAAPPAPR